MAERLYRSRDDRMLAGVAAGVADALDADPSLVRIAWALLTIFTGGIALVVYIVMAIVVPEAPPGYTTMPPGPAAGAPGTAATSSGGATAFAGASGPSGTSETSGSAPAGPPPTSHWATDSETRRAARRARRRESGGSARGGVIAGVILIVVGGFFLIREFLPWFDWHLWWPIGLIALGGLLLVLALVPRNSSE